jgi:hypothetical protein
MPKSNKAQVSYNVSLQVRTEHEAYLLSQELSLMNEKLPLNEQKKVEIPFRDKHGNIKFYCVDYNGKTKIYNSLKKSTEPKLKPTIQKKKTKK